MDVDIKELKKKLKKYNQEHLLLKYDEMNDADKQRLLNEINNIDFDLIGILFVRHSFHHTLKVDVLGRISLAIS